MSPRWTAPMRALVAGLSPGARRTIENRSPVPLSPRHQTMFGARYNATNMIAYMQAYSTDAVVHPIVSRLAESTAEATWGLFKEGASGEIEDRTVIKSAAVLDLLDHPSDYQTLPEIVEAGQQHFELTGETNIVLGITPGIKLPLDMYVIRPDRLEPVPDPYEFLRGWIYTAPGDGQRIPLETSELLRIVHPSPLDPYRGMGWVQALLRDLDAQQASKEYLAAFFQNSAKPGGILEVDRRLTDDEFLEMSTRWGAQHQGISKAHRVAILEQAKWVDSSFSLRDLQMAELDNVSRDKALVAAGFPKSMLGIVEDVNRANAEAGEYVFARWLIRPRLKRWRSMFNHQLMAHYFPDRNAQRRSGLVLDFVDPVPENSEQALEELKTKTDVVVALVAEGFDAPEVLDMVGFPALTFEKPEPEVIKVPSSVGAPAKELPAEPQDALVLAYARASGMVENAMRWRVEGHKDANCCDPCEKNIDKLYRSRTAAYADYPGGKSYIKCVGEEFGNHCRCRVVKRRQK